MFIHTDPTLFSSFNVSLTPSSEIEEIFLPDEMILKIFSRLKNNWTFHQARILNKRWMKLAEGLGPAILRRLCLCSHPLILGQKKQPVPYLDSSQNQIFYSSTDGTDTFKIFIYDLKKKEITNNIVIDACRFMGFIDRKFYIVNFQKISHYDTTQNKIIELVDYKLPSIEFDVHQVMMNEQHKRLAISLVNQKVIKIYNCVNGTTVDIIQDAAPGVEVRCHKWTFAGDRLVVVYEERYPNIEPTRWIKIYSAEGKELAKKQFKHALPQLIEADEQHLAIFYTKPQNFYNLGRIKIFDSHTLEEQRTLKTETGCFGKNKFIPGNLDALILRLKNRKLQIHIAGDLIVFDVSTGEILKKFRCGGCLELLNRPLSIEGNTIALGVQKTDLTYAVEIWDIETGKFLQSYPVSDRVKKVILNIQDQHQLIALTKDGLVHVWNTDLEKERVSQQVSEEPQLPPQTPPTVASPPIPHCQPPLQAPSPVTPASAMPPRPQTQIPQSFSSPHKSNTRGFFSKITDGLRWLGSRLYSFFARLFQFKKVNHL